MSHLCPLLYVSHHIAALFLMLIIQLLADGCSEPMIENLDRVLPMLIASLSDNEPRVRAAACIAVNQFSSA